MAKIAPKNCKNCTRNGKNCMKNCTKNCKNCTKNNKICKINKNCTENCNEISEIALKIAKLCKYMLKLYIFWLFYYFPVPVGSYTLINPICWVKCKMLLTLKALTTSKNKPGDATRDLIPIISVRSQCLTTVPWIFNLLCLCQHSNSWFSMCKNGILHHCSE